MKHISFCISFFCNLDSDVAISTCVFFTYPFFCFGGTGFYCFDIFSGNKDFTYGFSCDGIVFLTTFIRNDFIIGVLFESIEKSSHNNVGICAFFINFRTGMSAHKSTDFYLKFFTLCCNALNRNVADCGKTSGTADPETSFCFRIHIDHAFAAEYAAIQSESSEKTDLFIYSNQNLQCWVRDVCAVKKCKGVSNCNAIITAESGSVCRYVSVFDRKVQTVFCKVMLYIRSFFADHIHMSLKDNGRSIFVSWGRGFVDNDVVQFILNIFEAMLFCKIYKIITDLSGVSGTMRDLADFLKIIKDFFGFAIF